MGMRTNGVDLVRRRVRGATADWDGEWDLKVHEQRYDVEDVVHHICCKDTLHAFCPVRNDSTPERWYRSTCTSRHEAVNLAPPPTTVKHNQSRDSAASTDPGNEMSAQYRKMSPSPSCLKASWTHRSSD
jgi:hypothetical protein